LEESSLKQDGAGNSSITRSYSFTDNSPETGTNYYRIRQTDFDGKNATSKIVTSSNSAKNNIENVIEVNVFPNPFSNFIQFNFNSEKESEMTFKLANQIGQILVIRTYKCDVGNNNFEINSLENLKKGSYFLIIEKDDKILKTMKILKL